MLTMLISHDGSLCVYLFGAIKHVLVYIQVASLRSTKAKHKKVRACKQAHALSASFKMR